MTLHEMMELLDYNLWANNRLFEAATQLKTEQYFQDVKASHGGVHGTLTHIVGAQKLWLARWTSSPDATLIHGKDVSTLLELIALWETVSSQTAEFFQNFTEAKLRETILITTTTGKEFTHTFQQMIHHLVNHSSSHRGQIQSMMRQFGISPPNIDLITYYRRNKST
jgi:uncharacterized damage-inducible protein DinB